MRSNDVVPEEADGVEVLAGRQTFVFRCDVLHFGLRLGDVDEDRRAELGGELAHLLEVLA